MHEKYIDQRHEMVINQLHARGILNKDVLGAMLKVPREEFVPENYRERTYYDGPLPIGEDQTISQPYIVALMTQLLSLKKEDKVLEAGTGSGYQAAILAEICKVVYTVELKEKLSLNAQEILKKLGYENIHFKIGNAYEGWPEFSPYDAIIATCAPKDIPCKLLDQLKDGGRMVVPVGAGMFSQTLYLVKKCGNKITKTDCGEVIFVPMIE